MHSSSCYLQFLRDRIDCEVIDTVVKPNLGIEVPALVDRGLVDGLAVELKVGDTGTAADPVQPKEGPLGPRVEQHEDADGDRLAHWDYEPKIEASELREALPRKCCL